MTVQEIVTAKCKGQQLSAQTAEVAIAEVEQAIKNYCNISAVPEELNFIWANMVVDCIRYQQSVCDANNPNTATTLSAADVSSLKIGDTTVTLGNGSNTDLVSRAIKSHTPNLDKIVMNYRAQLNKYRRMVW